MDGFMREYIETDDGLIWTVGTMLTKYFVEHKAEMFKGKRILELGSGLGHLGLRLSELGAHVTCSEHPASFPVLQRRLSGSGVACVPLLWGPTTPLADLLDFDYIIGSEIIYEEMLHDDLICTLLQLCQNGAKYYNAFADRPFSCMFFAKLADAGFKIEEVDDLYDRIGLEPDRVAIHCISLI